MTRGGTKKTSEAPERRCIASGETRDKGDLLRFVVGPDQAIVPDLKGSLPGRGVWVTATRASVDKASKKGLFSRAAKTAVKVPDGLSDLIEQLTATKLVQSLSLARKAGLAVCGFEKVKSALVSESADLLIQASDGSRPMKSKLRAPNGPESLIECLNSQELGLAFSRDHVIHAALMAGGVTPRVRAEAKLLSGFRQTE